MAARAQKAWSLMDLSKETGIHKQTLHNYEKGIKPSHKNLKKLCKAFGVPIEFFTTENSTTAIKSKPLLKGEIESKVKLISGFSEAEQEALIRIIDQIIDKRRLSQKLEEIAMRVKF